MVHVRRQYSRDTQPQPYCSRLDTSDRMLDSARMSAAAQSRGIVCALAIAFGTLYARDVGSPFAYLSIEELTAAHQSYLLANTGRSLGRWSQSRYSLRSSSSFWHYGKRSGAPVLRSCSAFRSAFPF